MGWVMLGPDLRARNLAKSAALGQRGPRPMLSRAFGLMLALFVVPLAWGRAIEEPALAVAVPPGALAGPAPVAAALVLELGEVRIPEAGGAPLERLEGAPEPSVAANVEAMPQSDPASGFCPPGMVHVDGDHCLQPKHVCERWLDDPALPYARCAKYREPTLCEGERVRMSYCIDQREFTPEGESVPLNFQSFDRASRLCASMNRRLCTEREWNFACEGETMRPYPYGFSREPKCNQDRRDLYEENPRRQVLRDLRAPAGSHSECTSSFGVQDMVGNVDEPVLRELAGAQAPFRNALKGGWWMPGRNRCRPATTAHDDYYQGIQVGVRCCADLAPAATADRREAGRAG